MIRLSKIDEVASMEELDAPKEGGEGGAAHALKLLGKRLDLTALTYAKKFRHFGWKSGALKAFQELEKAGNGDLQVLTTKTSKVRQTRCTLYPILSVSCIQTHIQVSTK